MIAAVPAAYRSSTAKRGNPLWLAALGALGRLGAWFRSCAHLLFPPSLFLLIFGEGAGTHPCPTQINRAVDPELDELA